MPETHDSDPFLLTKGPLIVSLESCFFHWQKYPPRRVAPQTPPLHEMASPRELEDPWRVGHGHAFRFPLLRRGFVLGYWEPAGEPVLEEEESAKLLEAVQGAHIPGITADEIKTWAKARSYSWFELLLRRFAWLGRAYDRVGPTVTFSVKQGVQKIPVSDGTEEYAIVDWIDAPIIDLEDARTSLPDSQGA